MPRTRRSPCVLLVAVLPRDHLLASDDRCGIVGGKAEDLRVVLAVGLEGAQADVGLREGRKSHWRDVEQLALDQLALEHVSALVPFLLERAEADRHLADVAAL